MVLMLSLQAGPRRTLRRRFRRGPVAHQGRAEHAGRDPRALFPAEQTRVGKSARSMISPARARREFWRRRKAAMLRQYGHWIGRNGALGRSREAMPRRCEPGDEVAMVRKAALALAVLALAGPAGAQSVRLTDLRTGAGAPVAK